MADNEFKTGEPMVTVNLDNCNLPKELKQKVGDIMEDNIKNVLENEGYVSALAFSLMLNGPLIMPSHEHIEIMKELSILSRKIEKHSCYNRCVKTKTIFKNYKGLLDIIFCNGIGNNGQDYKKMLYTVKVEMDITNFNLNKNTFDFLRNTAKTFFADKNVNLIIKEYMLFRLKKWVHSYYKNKCYQLAIEPNNVSGKMLNRSMKHDYNKLYKLLGVLREIRNDG